MSLRSLLFSRLTLFPDRFVHSEPGDLGLEAEAVEFSSRSGTRLRGHFVRGASPGIVVLCCGNSGNASAHAPYLTLLARTRRSVLSFDYRGFGPSEGRPDLARVPDDIAAAARFARERAAAAPIFLHGLSLGAGGALAAAARGAQVTALSVEGVSDLSEMLAGLLTCGSFGPLRPRVAGMEGDGVASSHHPSSRRPARIGRGGWPRPLARWAARGAASLYPFAGKRPTALAAALGKTPVFIAHGLEDPLLPFEAAEDLFHSLRGPRELWLIAGAGHAQEPALAEGVAYTTKLTRWYERAAAAFPGAAMDGEPTPCGPTGRPQEARGDALGTRYREGGYGKALRSMALAVNERSIARLDAAFADWMRLERARELDFVAALYALRGAEVALGRVASWRLRERSLARAFLVRYLELRSGDERANARARSEPARSPLVWAERELDGLDGA